MSISFKSKEREPISKELIEEFHNRTGLLLPQGLLDILRVANGGELECQIFKINNKIIQLTYILPVTPAAEPGSIRTLFEFDSEVSAFDIRSNGNVDSKQLIIFGRCFDDIYFGINYQASHNPSVFTTILDGKEGVTLKEISPSFQEFIASIYHGEETNTLHFSEKLAGEKIFDYKLKGIVCEAQAGSAVICLQLFIKNDKLIVHSILDVDGHIIDEVIGCMPWPENVSLNDQSLGFEKIERQVSSFRSGKYLNYHDGTLFARYHSVRDKEFTDCIFRITKLRDNRWACWEEISMNVLREYLAKTLSKYDKMQNEH